MSRRLLTLALLPILALPSLPVSAAEKLAEEFARPPRASQAWCYWWWLNGLASKEGITRDLEEMKLQGIRAALITV